MAFLHKFLSRLQGSLDIVLVSYSRGWSCLRGTAISREEGESKILYNSSASWIKAEIRNQLSQLVPILSQCLSKMSIETFPGLLQNNFI